MEFHAGKCRHTAANGALLLDGAVQIALDEEDVVIALDGGREYRLYYSDIERVTDRDYQLVLLMAGGDSFTLYFLGSW
ncbi:MAG: hypothetical protein ACM3XM_18595, partial [Mycobacterium leprae]